MSRGCFRPAQFEGTGDTAGVLQAADCQRRGLHAVAKTPTTTSVMSP